MQSSQTIVRRTLLATALLTATAAHADETTGPADGNTTTLPGILVTATATDTPTEITTDPKAPRQPLPAHDGADYLKTIPGFSVTRKGGTDGDAQFRGMSGSRLGILVDGENILGGCNARMDAPTAYIYPELYDTLTVIKGAQSVQHGPGNSAATVLFERKDPRLTDTPYRVYGSALVGSFGRHDELVDGTFGNRSGYLQLAATNSASDDYEDGDGNAVHSQYERYSLNGALGWTPDADSRIELAGTWSDGEAAYADRAMDGTKFERTGTRIRAEINNLSPQLAHIEASIYANDVDHVMDDQTLRTPGTMGYSNLLREGLGGKAAAALNVGKDSLLNVGIDAREDDHSSRNAPVSGVYTAWRDDASFTQQGLFAEIDHGLDAQSRMIAGARLDDWEATDERAMILVMTMGGMTMNMNPTAGQTREDMLVSAFARLEHTLTTSPTTLYFGMSQVERFPDYWELIAKRGVTSDSAFDTTQPERTHQLDAGAVYRQGNTTWSASVFRADINDYLLIDYAFMNMDKMMTGVTRNIDATTYGGELGASHVYAGHWKVESTLAWTHGTNDSDQRPLAQVAPLEGRLGLTYSTATWSVGSLLRAVDDQSRYDLNRGTVVGKDLGPAPGFAIFSINGSWTPAKDALVSAGIDNLFDRRYAEFVSRTGSNGMGGAIPGYTQTTRVNEPGRTLWLKASMKF